MKKLPYIAGGIGLLLAATLAILYFTQIRPWIAPPEAPAWAIEERWKKVEELAALPAECTEGDPASMRAFYDAEPGSPEAVAAFLAWHRTVGAWGQFDQCDAYAFSPLRPLETARRAIGQFWPEDAGPADFELDHERLAAALRLAAQYRRCGDFLGVSIGFILAQAAVEQAREHGLRADRSFVERRPRAEEVLPAIARGAICTVTLIEGNVTPSPPTMIVEADGTAMPASESPPPSAGALRILDRELLFHKQHWADLLLPHTADPSDLSGLALTLEPIDEELLPKSMLLRGGLDHQDAKLVRKMATILAEYDAFLAEGVVDAGVDGG